MFANIAYVEKIFFVFEMNRPDHFPRRSFFRRSSGFTRPSDAASSISRNTATQAGVFSINFLTAYKVRRWSKSSRSVYATPRILAIFLRLTGPGCLRPASRSQTKDGDTPAWRPSSRNVIPADSLCARTLSPSEGCFISPAPSATAAGRARLKLRGKRGRKGPKMRSRDSLGELGAGPFVPACPHLGLSRSEGPQEHMNSNHNHRRINRETIRLAFQIPGSYDLKPSKIWRIRTEASVHDFRLEGFFLDDPKTLCRTAVTHVGVGEVVMITFTSTDGIQPAPVAFRINAKGVPEPHEDLSAFNVNQIVSHGPSIDFDGRGFVHFAMEDLCAFMCARHPRWLQNQVDATLRSWRTEAPDLFVKVAPSHWLGKKPWLLASLDPKQALEEHNRQLGDELRRYCIRRLIPNKNQILNRSLPSALKSSKHYQNASFLLKHHLPELDDTQLRICAFTNPTAALARYSQVADLRRRALLLSCAFRHAWTNRILMRDPEFHQDVIDSLTEFSIEWATSNPEGLVAVLRLISARIPSRPTSADLIRMIERMDPQSRQCVVDFITSRI